MFDTLTPDERQALASKLAAWSHEFHQVAEVLARTALMDGDYNGIAWTRRERYTAARAELVVLRADVLAA